MAVLLETRRRRVGATSDRRQTRPMSEINVTPLVDVMLVLLVIFMITAPLMTTGVQIDLPKAETAEVNTPNEPLSVTVTKAGKIYIGDRETTMPALIAQISTTAANNPDARVFIRGDEALAYGQVITVIAAIHNAGLHKVALLTQPAAGASPGGNSSGEAPAAARQRASLR